VEAKRSRNSYIVAVLACGITRAKPLSDCREDVGEREAFVAQSWQALTALRPDVARPSFLGDARLVAKKEADALVLLNFSEECRVFVLDAASPAVDGPRLLSGHPQLA
jgi:hypothetical protein